MSCVYLSCDGKIKTIHVPLLFIFIDIPFYLFIFINIPFYLFIFIDISWKKVPVKFIVQFHCVKDWG